ncbi:MAG: DUF58 domain-containing protein [Candidatus Methylacidiphilales bacterium]
MAVTSFLDNETLDAIEDLSLIARLVVEGFYEGLHTTPYYGYSTEFASYRPYVQGDDLRLVDWRAWARTDRFYVKQFEDDTHLNCHLFLDTSASMNFGEGACHKFTYARLLTAVLVHLMVRQHDAPALVLYGSHRLEALPPGSGLMHEDALLQLLARAEPRGTLAEDDRMLALVSDLTRRGLIIVVSDFLNAARDPMVLLRQLPAHAHEVILFHVVAPEEMNFKLRGNLIMQDPETGEELLINAEAVRRNYELKFRAFCRELEEQSLRLGIDYHRLYTDQPVEIALRSYIERRALH